jgi:uncharacterized protein YuzE
MAAAEIDSIEKIAALVPHLRDISHKKIWVDYDQEADVLYVNFKKSAYAEDSELTDDDVITIRYEKGQVVEMTFLHASKRQKSPE